MIPIFDELWVAVARHNFNKTCNHNQVAIFVFYSFIFSLALRERLLTVKRSFNPRDRMYKDLLISQIQLSFWTFKIYVARFALSPLGLVY